MNKRQILGLFLPAQKFFAAFPDFLNFLSHYFKEKLVSSSIIFELIRTF